MKLQVSLHSCAFSSLITIRCPWHGEWHACGLWTNNNPLRLMLVLMHIHTLHWVIIVLPFFIDLIFVILLVPSSLYQSNTIHDKSIGTQEQEVPFETMKCTSSLYGKTQSYNRCFIVSIGKEYLWICSLCYGQVCLHNNNFTTLLWVTFNSKNFDSFFHVLYLFHITHVLLFACKVEPPTM